MEIKCDEKRKMIFLTRRSTGKNRSLNIGCILSFDWILEWKCKGHLYFQRLKTIVTSNASSTGTAEPAKC